MKKQPPPAATAASPTSMRERIARAVYAVSAKKFNSRKTWEECTPAYRDLVYEEVDAMLNEIEVPTDAMIEAGGQNTSFGPRNVVAYAHFRAMIKAVKEGK